MATFFSDSIKANTLSLAGLPSHPYGTNYVAKVLASSPPGQIEYRTPGSYTFVVPAEVFFVCAVCIGGGGAGGYAWSQNAAGGGATAWANDIPVTPGQSITVTVGGGGNHNVTTGGTSSFGSFFSAQGGIQSSGTSSRAIPVSGTVTASGGRGGCTYNSNWAGGGGGAGGYSGDGGDGNYGTNLGPNGGSGSGGGAAGGFGYQSSTYGFGGGGGVDLYGEGLSGTQQASQFNSNWGNTWSYVDSSTTPHAGGMGGSGGEYGSPNSNTSQTFYGRTTYHGEGGRCGGGGAGSSSSQNSNSNYCKGAHGGVRIIWGLNRSYPKNAT